MADVTELIAALGSLPPDQKAALAEALGVPTGTEEPKTELEHAQAQVDEKQTQIADLAGSEQALSDPGSAHDEIRQLHDQLTSLQVQVANLLRAQLVITDEPPPPA